MRWFLSVVLILVVVSASGAFTSATHAQATEFQIVEQQPLTTEHGRIFAISPNGERLVAWRDTENVRELCVLDAEQLSDLVCAPFTKKPDPEAYEWSPDGTRIAITEDLQQELNDSDLWVFDTDSGTLTNLSDDHYADIWLNAPFGTPFDLSPTWSPDGTEIAFVRCLEIAEGAVSTKIYRIAATGGEPREVTTIAPEWFAVYTGVHWLEDDSIVYPVDIARSSEDGLWTVAANGGTPHQIVSQSELGASLLVLAEVSSLNQGLLFVVQDSGPNVLLVDLMTGQTEAVSPPGPDPSSINGMTFSPDGKQLLLSNHPNQSVAQPLQLTIRSLESGDEYSLGELNQPFSALYRGGFVWTTSDRVFGTEASNSGFLLILAPA